MKVQFHLILLTIAAGVLCVAGLTGLSDYAPDTLEIISPVESETLPGCSIRFAVETSLNTGDVMLEIDETPIEGDGEVDIGGRLISISGFSSDAGSIEFKGCGFYPGAHTFWAGYDHDGDGSFDGPDDLVAEVHFSTMYLQESGYEKVLSMSADGSVTYGDWDGFFDLVTNQAADCKLRFDDRIASPKHIEFAEDSILFDFAPLHAAYPYYDGYAYVHLQNGTRAGIGTSYRRGQPDIVWRKDREQYDEFLFVEMPVDVFCDWVNPYQPAGPFEADGSAAPGSFDELHELVTEHAATCKVKYDNRISPAVHVEFDEDDLYFDFLSLSAYCSEGYQWEAYAYVNVRRDSRAGLGASYRRGIASEVWKKDRDQYGEMAWNSMRVDVFCRDEMEQVLTMDDAGQVLEGSWDDLVQKVVHEQRECKFRFDQRIGTPVYAEYAEEGMHFDFHNLSAWFDYWEAIAYIDIQPDLRAGIGTTYRRGHPDMIYRTTFEQYGEAGWNAMPVDVFCESDGPGFGGYRLAGSLTSTGTVDPGSWDDFRDLITEQVPDCKVRFDQRIFRPDLYEVSDSYVHFDLLSLNAHYTYDAYALYLLETEDRAGLGSLYRVGSPDHVWKKDFAQTSLVHFEAVDAEVFCQGIFTGASECGNGLLEEGEICDDGNMDPDDGCSHECRIEAGWTCPVPGTPCVTLCNDSDWDGYGDPATPDCLYPEGDCNDTNPDINPGMPEIPYNEIDDDCNPDTPGSQWIAPQPLADTYAGANKPASDVLNYVLLWLAPVAAVLIMRIRRMRK
ncbi:MopE-related protein [Thermodesulfobacteriota bacterium]